MKPVSAFPRNHIDVNATAHSLAQSGRIGGDYFLRGPYVHNPTGFGYTGQNSSSGGVVKPVEPHIHIGLDTSVNHHLSVGITPKAADVLRTIDSHSGD